MPSSSAPTTASLSRKKPWTLRKIYRRVSQCLGNASSPGDLQIQDVSRFGGRVVGLNLNLGTVEFKPENVVSCLSSHRLDDGGLSIWYRDAGLQFQKRLKQVAVSVAPKPSTYNFRSGSRATCFHIALIGGTCRVGGHCPSVVDLFDHSLLRLNVSSDSEAIAYIFRIQPTLPDFSRANGTWGNFHFLLSTRTIQGCKMANYEWLHNRDTSTRSRSKYFQQLPMTEPTIALISHLSTVCLTEPLGDVPDSFLFIVGGSRGC